MFSKIVNKFLSVSFDEILHFVQTPHRVKRSDDITSLFKGKVWKRALIYSAIGLSALLAILAVLFPGTRLMIAFFIYIATLNSGLIPFPTMTTVIFLGKSYSPFLVAAVGTSGSAVSSIIIYYMVTKFSKNEWLKKIENSSIIGSWKALTCKSPFLSLVVSNALPLPIEPSRFLAIFNRYSITKYIVAISLGRFIRYFLLAALGETFQISNGVLIVLTVVLLIAPFLVKSVRSGSKSLQTLLNKIITRRNFYDTAIEKYRKTVDRTEVLYQE